MDNALEREFLSYDMRRYISFVGPITLIFGVIYMLFFVFDNYGIEKTQKNFSFILILFIRILVFAISVIIYLFIKKINNYVNLIYLITSYEIITVVSFLVIMCQYRSFTYLTFFSVISITLAVYIMPNRLINAQVVSAFLLLFFFVLPAKHMEGLETADLLKVIAYNLMVFIFCNIGAYMTNFYKRKQFADSRELTRVSITDSLTGIYNRAKFDEELNQWVDSCNSCDKPLSLVIFDIDDFKRVNDTYGHHTGDDVIKKVVATIKNIIRSTDIFARWGGEEFAILLPNTSIRQAMEIAEQMKVNIQKSKCDKVENITCSFGLVALRKNENAESFMQRADRLLYSAKDLGKNIVVCEGSRIGNQMKSDTNTGFVSNMS